MRVLVLGGTRFAGRAIVETFAAAGHDATCFHRGRSRCDLPLGVREAFGDRNEQLPAALHAPWDAIIDVSGQLPEQVRRSADLDAGRYLFISTLSVYADQASPGINEDSATILEFDPTDAAAAYGGNKAACERIVSQRFGERAAILRPGIIVGRWDYTGRFTYWPRRALRGGRFVVPAPPQRPLQFVDARDLAEFALRVVVEGIGGTFNVAGPRDSYSMGECIAACVAAAQERGVRADAVYVDGAALIAAGVEPWTDLPMWVDDPADAGIFQVGNRCGVEAGLRFRTPDDTIRVLMDWIATPEGSAAPQPGLSLEREEQILAGMQA